MSDEINYDEISRDGLVDMLEEATSMLEEATSMLEEATSMLEEATSMLNEQNARIRELEAKLVKDVTACMGALGHGIPVRHDGKMSDSTTPENVLAKFLSERVNVLEDRNEKMEAALIAVLNWSKAYPVEVFPEPDLNKARELLEAGGVSSAALYASHTRHLLKRITEIVHESLPQPEA